MSKNIPPDEYYQPLHDDVIANIEAHNWKESVSPYKDYWLTDNMAYLLYGNPLDGWGRYGGGSAEAPEQLYAWSKDPGILNSQYSASANYTAGALIDASKVFPPLMRIPVKISAPIINNDPGNEIAFKIIENRSPTVKVSLVVAETGQKIIDSSGKVWNESPENGINYPSGSELPYEKSFSINWKGNVVGNPLSDGNYTLQVSAQDSDGNNLPVMDNDGDGVPDTTAAFKIIYTALSLDSTPPPAPAVQSPTHPDPNAQYLNDAPVLTWTTPDDATGIKGYSWVLDQIAATMPDATSDGIGNQTSYTGVLPGIWYFHIRAQDWAGNWGEAAHFRINIAPPPDDTPPSIPVVMDDGIDTANPTQLHASWSSNDPESEISEYLYAIGTTPYGEDVIPFTSAGVNTGITRTGLNLAKGQTYYFSVKAKNGAGLFSEAGVSDGILITNTRPIANTDGPYGTFIGKPVTFDGTMSFDPDGDVLSYLWDFGDGTIGTGVAPSHIYPSIGIFSVKLTVSDGKIASEPSITSVNVAEFQGASRTWTTVSDFTPGVSSNTIVVSATSLIPDDGNVQLELGDEQVIIDQPYWDIEFNGGVFYWCSQYPVRIDAGFHQRFRLSQGFILTKISPLMRRTGSYTRALLSLSGPTISYRDASADVLTSSFSFVDFSFSPYPIVEYTTFTIRVQPGYDVAAAASIYDKAPDTEGIIAGECDNELFGIPHGGHDWTFKLWGRQYPDQGGYISSSFDIGTDSVTWGPFVVSDDKPTNTSVLYFTQTSADGVNWG
ncbi:MAG: PKD domain-containing protein, partial [Nanoarchaeota archaeon]|nr:PKD domain-containing protein [Nanoarchaeota archaeon]